LEAHSPGHKIAALATNRLRHGINPRLLQLEQ
jgi:hypothetical protein